MVEGYPASKAGVQLLYYIPGLGSQSSPSLPQSCRQLLITTSRRLRRRLPLQRPPRPNLLPAHAGHDPRNRRPSSANLGDERARHLRRERDPDSRRRRHGDPGHAVRAARVGGVAGTARGGDVADAVCAAIRGHAVLDYHGERV